ncbi:hypothetical protein GH714_013875 [Hevea brasiliensis]|uniref:3-phosphoshikimate 1-carboxyvinyltransferase n=1 Tax=Hevea brasiliensis TaxID=3981 RepID=A0A6A6LLL2_HEVBR|nr:hypothetical protein GH714_013875 [Hevea brasiliensis]
MASTSSVTLSQALFAPAISHHGSAQSSDHHCLSFSTPSLPSFSGLKSTSSSIPRATSSLRRRLVTLQQTRIRAAAVETLGATAETSLVEKSVNTIRFLAIDAVEKANSGHPGLPMGCAPIGHILYDEIMRYNPKNPYWFNRDRFVLSAGHGCMLQYALLHLAGYDSVKEEDLKNFRQWGSKTPGHPENFETPVLKSQLGVANAVGLALAEKHLAARFNKPDNEIVDHYTYVILGDGCQMEGIANEACSLAGHWGLGKLIAFYDDNHISIDGDTAIAFTESVDKRFEGLGWHVIWVKNGNTGYDDIRAAIKEAKAVKDKPTLIKALTEQCIGMLKVIVHFKVTSFNSDELLPFSVGSTTIGYGSPNKANSYSVHGSALGAKEVDATRKNLAWPYEPFHVPEDVRKHWSRHISVGAALEAEWNKSLPKSPAEATRNLSQANLNALAKVLPGLLGGSADLASSNMTLLKMFGDFQKDTPEERNVRFGVREHGMGAICNGIALHSPGLIPYCATFFVFTDYMRAAIRISALSEAGVIYPGNETAGAYKVAVLNRKRPSILALSRQKLPNLAGTSIEGVEKGGYIISDNSSGNKPDVILIGTGSELEIAAKAAEELRKGARLVSIEAGSTFGWEKIVGAKGKAIGIDRFGASAQLVRYTRSLALLQKLLLLQPKKGLKHCQRKPDCTVDKVKRSPVRVSASVATSEKPSTAPEIVLQPIKEISGTVTLPGSKSLSNRILLLAALSEGTTVVDNLLNSDDVRHMLGALRTLGLHVEDNNELKRAIVEGCGSHFPVGKGSKNDIELFLGNAGTAMRPLTAAVTAAGGNSSYILDGVPRMRERPIGDLVAGLKQLGADVECSPTNCPPVRINGQGGLPGGKVKLSGSISSQYLTALLMAAPLALGDVEIEIIDKLISIPYVEMTLRLMERYGVTVEHTSSWDRFFIRGGDASSASYFLAGAAITGGTITVEGCGTSSLQGDVKFAEVLEKMGAKVTWTENSVTVTGPPRNSPSKKHLRAIDINMNKMPDVAMTLAVVALFADGRTAIRCWRVKETERMIAICTELRKLGATVEEGPDYCVITPPEKLNIAEIDTYDDHRMAMAFSLAACGDVPVTIKDPGCTRKTFPDYFEVLERFTEH